MKLCKGCYKLAQQAEEGGDKMLDRIRTIIAKGQWFCVYGKEKCGQL